MRNLKDLVTADWLRLMNSPRPARYAIERIVVEASEVEERLNEMRMAMLRSYDAFLRFQASALQSQEVTPRRPRRRRKYNGRLHKRR